MSASIIYGWEETLTGKDPFLGLALLGCQSEQEQVSNHYRQDNQLETAEYRQLRQCASVMRESKPKLKVLQAAVIWSFQYKKC